MKGGTADNKDSRTVGKTSVPAGGKHVRTGRVLLGSTLEAQRRAIIFLLPVYDIIRLSTTVFPVPMKNRSRTSFLKRCARLPAGPSKNSIAGSLLSSFVLTASKNAFCSLLALYYSWHFSVPDIPMCFETTEECI